MKKTLSNLIKTGITVASLVLALTASTWAGYEEISQSSKETKSIDSSTKRDKILVITNSNIYGSISSSLNTYAQDLESEDYYVIKAKGKDGTSQELKDFIKKYYDGTVTTGLTGVILISDLPTYTQSGTLTDMYFMDMDGEGSTSPEIWVGRLATNKLSSGKTGKTEGKLLQDYFTRNHNYRVGALSLPQHKGLVYDSSDTNLQNAYSSYSPYSTDFSGKLSEGYEWIHLEGSLSTTTAAKAAQKFVFSNGDAITYSAIKKKNPQVVFYTLFSPYSGTYTTANYIGGYCVFANSYGLAAIARTGSATGTYDKTGTLYEKLGKGGKRRSLGSAFLSALQDTFNNGSSVYDLTILGDPTLSIDPPIAAITTGYPTIDGNDVTFSGTGSLKNETSLGIAYYCWSSSDGTIDSSNLASNTHTQLDIPSGEYNVYFKVLDNYNRWSSPANKIFTVGTVSEKKPLETPILTATPQSPTSILLSWTDASGGNAKGGFQIEQKKSTASTWSVLTTKAYDSTTTTYTYTSTDLSEGTTYTFQVRALAEKGSSTYTDSEYASAQASTSSSKLTAPVISSDYTPTISSITLSGTWTDTSSGVGGDYIKLKRRISTGESWSSWTELSTSTSTLPAAASWTYTDSGLTAGKRYQYQAMVVAKGTYTSSDYSASKEASTKALDKLSTPTNKSPSNITKNSIKVNWDWMDNSSGQAKEFKIQRKTGSSGWGNEMTAGLSERYYSYTGLNKNTKYYFRVQAIIDPSSTTYSSSEWSEIKSATTSSS